MSNFELYLMTVTGQPEFDFFFSLVFEMGMVSFAIAGVIRLYLNRTK